MRKSEYVRGGVSAEHRDTGHSDTSARSSADWEKVEGQYRAGIMTLRAMAKENAITEGAIRKRAKRDGWEKDLSAKIEARAEELVRKEVVRNEVRNSPKMRTEERAIVECNAKVIADAVIHQRRDVSQARAIVQKLFAEMEGMIDGLESLNGLADMMADPEANHPQALGEGRH